MITSLYYGMLFYIDLSELLQEWHFTPSLLWDRLRREKLQRWVAFGTFWVEMAERFEDG